MRESIFSSAIRSFFIALFAMIAICLSIIPLFIIVAALITALSDTTVSLEPETTYTEAIAANANGERKAVSNDAPVILKLNVNGIIGTDSLNMNTIRRQLQESREKKLKNNRVKGVLLYIDSPGGTVVDSDGIYHAIKAYKEKYKVPVYAFVDGLCASGGMYSACAADKIYASDVSLIGSVGVLSPSFINVTSLIDKIGVQALTLTAGKDKDLMNPLRPWKPGEEKEIQNLIDYYYQMFVNIVVSNRPEIDKTKLINDYGAHLFNAKQAQEYGYINASGYNYDMALKELLEAAGIKDDVYQVIELQKKTWFSDLFSTELSLFKGKVTHQIQLTPHLDSHLVGKYLYMYDPAL